MHTYIILLRGINVGGHKKVPMAELRDLLTKAGFQNIQTYIQSGNVVFQSSEKASELESEIQKLIYNYFGFEVSVIVKTNAELKAIFDACPFSEEKKQNSYFILLSDIPDSLLVKKVEEMTFENEEVIIRNDCLYFYSSTGYGRTKFNMNTFERKLNVSGTARNYKTIFKLIEMTIS